MRILLHSLLIAAATLGAAGSVCAQAVGDPAVGHQLAQKWCSNCHAVEPLEKERTTDAAPSFSAVAHSPSTTAMGLRAFLQTSHGQMPDFRLSRDQIDDVVAYILSLRGG